MNEIEKQEQEPTATAQAESTEATDRVDSSQKPPKASQKLAIVALILALAGLVLGYLKWGELETLLQQERETLAELKKQQQESKGRQDKSDQAITAQKTAFTEQDERIKLQAEEMQQSLDLVYERVGRSSTQWLVAEAEYLMRIANHRLQLEGDSNTALVALERADKRLRDSGDPVWTPVREKLASEMAELKGLKELDLAGQAAKLSGLISQVEKLKLPHSVSVASDKADESSKEEKEFSFDAVMQDFWEGFKSLLKVRRHDRPVTTMLEPDQIFFLYQNLRLQLEGARVALLSRNQALFDASLQRIESWIKEYFDQENALTKSMLKGVSELRKLELETKMPDVSGSLRMLLEQQGRGEEVAKQEEEQQEEAEPEPIQETQGSEESEEQAVSEKPEPVDADQTPVVQEQKPVDGAKKPASDVQESINGEENKSDVEEQKETP